MDLKNIDLAVIKRWTSPQAVKDFDRFLDSLPMTVGYNALIAAGLAWLLAGGAVFFTSAETQKVSKMRADLMQIQALQPPIPTLKYTPVNQDILKGLGDKISATYKGVTVTATDGNALLVAQDTDFFPQFLAAISYFQRGGRNWKVRIDTLCVGNSCTGSKLSANLKIESVRVGEPEAQKEPVIN